MRALNCFESRGEEEKEGNQTRMRPMHGRSRLCECVSMFCFHPLQCLFCFPPINDLIEFAVFGALSVLTSSVLVASTALRVLCCIFVMLSVQGEGSTKQTCMVCVSPFHQQPSCEPRSHISEDRSIDRHDTRSQTVAESGWFRLFGVQQMRHLVHCWGLRMGNCAFAVGLERAGSDECHVYAALLCDILNCQPFDLACFCFVVPFSDSRSFRPSNSCRT